MTATTVRHALSAVRHRPRWSVLFLACYVVGFGAVLTALALARLLLVNRPNGVRAPESLALLRPHLVFPGGPAVGALGDGLTNVAGIEALERASAPGAPIAAFATRSLLVGPAENGRSRWVAFVSQGYARTLGLGVAPGASSRDAWVSDRFWRSALGASRDVSGSTLRVGASTYRIAGVAGAGFRGLDDEPVDVWLPLDAARHELFGDDARTFRQVEWLTIVARLPHPAAREELTRRVGLALQEAYAGLVGRNFGGLVVVTSESLVDKRLNSLGKSAALIWYMLGLAVAVLLIAGANATNLLLVRAIDRGRELGVRLALGASRRGLVALISTEVGILLLVAVGGALPLSASLASAVAAAMWGGDRGPQPVVWSTDVLAGLAATTLLAWLVGAVVPTAVIIGADRGRTVRGGAATESRSIALIRLAVVAAQLAVSTILISFALRAADQIRRLSTLSLGFTADGAVIARVATPAGQDLRRHGTPLHDALAALPGVQFVSASVGAPLSGTLRWSGVATPGSGEASFDAARPVFINAVSDDYLSAVGRRLLHGRSFAGGRDGARDRVALVSLSFARERWGSATAGVGACVVVPLPGPGATEGDSQCRTVIGVIEDAAVESLDERDRREILLPLDQSVATNRMWLIVRGAGASALASAVRRAIIGVVPDLVSVDARPLADVAEPFVAPWRSAARIFGALSVCAFLLSALGLYGAVSYTVGRRERELALRQAMGATLSQVYAAALGPYVRWGLGGALAGGCVAVFTAGRTSAVFDAARSQPPWQVGIIALALVAVILASGFGAARRVIRRSIARTLQGL